MSSHLRRISDLTEKEFLDFPVWTWAEDDDESLVEPVQQLEPLPECHDALFIAARFTLGNGKLLNGSIAVRCSDRQVYLVEIKSGWHSVDLPLQNQKRFSEALVKMSEDIRIPCNEIIPILYETNYGFAGQPRLSGIVLNALEPD